MLDTIKRSHIDESSSKFHGTTLMNQEIDTLSLNRISKSFGQFAALCDINLHIRKGEFICFLGPSGCGKTTLLRIIAGLESQDDGQIIQDGHDISWLAPVKRDFGIVFQSYALFPNLTISENIAYGLVNRRRGKEEIKKRVQELLTLVGLPGSENKYPGQLSGGQQQRIALARALATAPGLLLLDEPLSALDALERVRLRGEIRQLQQRLGVTTIMVTHDQEEALAMADRIVVMNHGAIEQIGTPQQIYLQPQSPFVASFIGKVNVLRATALGGRRYRTNALEIVVAQDNAQLPIGSAIDVYLRPEDFVLRPVAERREGEAAVAVRKLEFIGAFANVSVAQEGSTSEAITLTIPLAQVSEYNLRVGAPAAVGVTPGSGRVFAGSPERMAS